MSIQNVESRTVQLKMFPDAEPVELKHREVFIEAYRHTPPSVADTVFTSLFGWQQHFKYQVSSWNDFLFVFYFADRRMMVLPPFLLSGTLDDQGWGEAFHRLALRLDEHCRQNGTELVFTAFPDRYAARLPADRFTAVPDRDGFDYVYRREALVQLAGSKLSAKRNLIKQFTRSYRYRYEVLSPQNLARCYRFILKWHYDRSPKNDIMGLAAYCMACRLVRNFAALDLYGGLLYADEKVVACSLGSIVYDFAYADGIYPTVIVHHENALVEYKGAYQAINRFFCEHLPENVVFVNREEDLGLAGLRKAKLSYGPDRLLAKNTVSLKR